MMKLVKIINLLVLFLSLVLTVSYGSQAFNVLTRTFPVEEIDYFHHGVLEQAPINSDLKFMTDMSDFLNFAKDTQRILSRTYVVTTILGFLIFILSLFSLVKLNGNVPIQS